MKHRISQAGRVAVTVLSLMLLGTSTAWAGEWKEPEEGVWYYEENGVDATGWIQDNGIWYYLEPETGIWQESPALNADTVCYLLENAVTRAGWYAGDEDMKIYQLDSCSSRKATIRILHQTSPTDIGGTINTFTVDMRTGTATAESTKLKLQLK